MDNYGKDLHRFEDLSEEELEQRILHNQKTSTSKRPKTSAQLVEGLDNFNKRRLSKIWKNVLLGVVKTILFPWIIIDFIREVRLYRKYTAQVRYVIDNNEEFFQFLERFQFHPAWFTRLYSNQEIPGEFIGLDDNQLEAVTVKAIMPIRPMLAKSNLLSILTLRIKRVAIDHYMVILEPENFKNVCALFWWMITIIATIIIAAVLGIVFLV